MINAYGTKTALYKKSALLNLNVKPNYADQPAKDGLTARCRRDSEKIPALRNHLANHLLAALISEDFSRSNSPMQKISFGGGEIVSQSDNGQNYVYLPETAVFSQLNFLRDGRTVETAMIGSEGIAGLSTVLGLDSPNVWTQISVAGTAHRVCAHFFKQTFSRDEFLQTAFLDYVNAYIRQISQRAVCNNHHRIEERFSTWLLMLDDRLGADVKNKLALTQEQIAQFLGVHRPSVTCIAQDLRDGGIIDYLRGRIYILDRPKLEAAACECYSVVN